MYYILLVYWSFSMSKLNMKIQLILVNHLNDSYKQIDFKNWFTMNTWKYLVSWGYCDNSMFLLYYINVI